MFSLTSSAFEPDAPIPARFTCDGEDVSPELSWEGVPEGTQSLALIMDDPDAPAGTFTHWVAYDIRSGARGLPENVEKTERPANGAGGTQGRNSFGDIGYGGPCPPSGTHHYRFQLYALDQRLDLAPGASKQQLLVALEGRVLGEALLVGTYQR
jgi:hypothetical protein